VGWLLAAIIVTRIVIGLVAWQRDLFVLTDEDFARYWLAKTLPNLVPGGWYVEVNPWLPLQLVTFHALTRLGEWSTAAILLFQNLVTTLTVIAAALFARELAEDSRAGWAAAGLLTGFHEFNLIGTSLLSEPLFGLSLILIAWGGWGVGTGRARLSLLMIGLLLGLTNRYEVWTYGLLVVAAVVWLRRADGEFRRRQAPWLIAIVAGIPSLWLLFNGLVQGNPVAFLTLTEEQFGLNVGPEGRGPLAFRMLAVYLQPVPLLIMLAAFATCIPAFNQSRGLRWLGWTVLFLTLQVCLLTMKGLSGFAHVERFAVPQAVLAAVAAGAMVSRIGGPLRAIQLLALALMGWGIGQLGLAESYLRRVYAFDVIRSEAREVARLRQGTGAREPLFVIDESVAGWKVVVFDLAAPNGWGLEAIDESNARPITATSTVVLAAERATPPWLADSSQRRVAGPYAFHRLGGTP
jgi:hypothetical protein